MNVDEILRRYDVTRYKNERLLQKRMEEVYGKIPQIEEIDIKIHNIRSFLFRSFADGDEGFAQIESLESQKKMLLVNNQYPEDYLDPIYNCRFCRDTGIDARTGGHCACFQKALLCEKYREFNITDEDVSFERFDLSIFPDDNPVNGLTQRQRMKKLKARCEKYANAFPNTEKPNMLFIGMSGLGKTYLLQCIAKRISERGYNCIFIPAYRIFNIFLQNHLNEADNLDVYHAVPLLIIDDLGTEPLVKNVTSEYFFLLINERLKNRRHTLFATNLSQSDLAERYGERIISRIRSINDTESYAFEGRDIRCFPNKKQ